MAFQTTGGIMKRRALLLGNTGGLEGIGVDIENTARFLMSSCGGQWYSSEITTLMDPSKKLATETIARIRDEKPDYTFFLFTGHGSHYGQTELCVNDKETILESDLNGMGDRQLSIFDCCRVERQLLKAANESYRSIAMDSVGITRDRYDMRILQAAKYHAKLYACSVGEFSYDTPDGAMYLSNLLRTAASIPLGYSTVSVEEAHAAAREKTIAAAAKDGKKQTPAASQAKLPRDMQLILSIK
jgi:hypothetical protein